MKTVRFLIDHSADPLWLYDDDGEPLDETMVPEVEADPEVVEDLDWIQHTYDSLFLNTPFEFSWWGFESPEVAQEFADKVEATAERLKELLGDKYVFVDDADRHPGIGRGPGQFHGGDDGRL